MTKYPSLKAMKRDCHLCNFETKIYDRFEEHMFLKHNVRFDHSTPKNPFFYKGNNDPFNY